MKILLSLEATFKLTRVVKSVNIVILRLLYGYNKVTIMFTSNKTVRHRSRYTIRHLLNLELILVLEFLVLFVGVPTTDLHDHLTRRSTEFLSWEIVKEKAFLSRKPRLMSYFKQCIADAFHEINNDKNYVSGMQRC